MKKDDFVKITEGRKPEVYMHTITIRAEEGDANGAVAVVLSHDHRQHSANFYFNHKDDLDRFVADLLQARHKIWGER